MVLVQLILAQGGDQKAPRAYRETRFYRATPTGWRRTGPDTRFWGAEETLETLDFVSRYRRRDAATVRAVAAKLDITYRTLRTSLGLPPASSNAKLVIDIKVADPADHAPPLPWTGDTLTVPSPQLVTAPVELAEVEILYQAIALRLVDRLVGEAIRHYQFDLEAWSIKGALRLWLLGESEGPLAVVIHEMTQWLYLDLQEQVPERREKLPHTYDQICELHKVWGYRRSTFPCP